MPNEVLADIYQQQLELLKLHLADFSEADMLKRPCNAANHTAWMLGHLATSEAELINIATPGAIRELDAALRERHSSEGAKLDDGFRSKDELLRVFEDTRSKSIEWVEKLTDADMKRDMPKQFENFAPTVAHLAHMIPLHATMHLGQIQAIRRALGKPVLF
jgi:hypothetical protein